ncbi:MAG TPA: GtrA family protein [Solirubrobacter sp.]|nr:GtrA family protein [Solirubrobacter sp.]
MSSLRAEGVRFVAVGAFITILYLSVTTVMRTVFDAPWWLAIAVGYAIATSTHFVLHRKVTFAKDEFQLSTGQQAIRFVAVVVAQYAFTATAMEILPATLITFFCVAAVVTVVSFLVLRTRLFH